MLELLLELVLIKLNLPHYLKVLDQQKSEFNFRNQGQFLKFLISFDLEVFKGISNNLNQ